ncbi:MAG: hypothetical protein CMF39_05950 [Legionellaceae bacterium]|nr:hypothetical protein [Legionellaceae bacterium]
MKRNIAVTLIATSVVLSATLPSAALGIYCEPPAFQLDGSCVAPIPILPLMMTNYSSAVGLNRTREELYSPPVTY